MPLTKASELRTLSAKDLEGRLEEFQKELMHERGVAAMGGAPANPGRIRALRISIARIKTVEREKEIKAKKEEK
ncbi:MAG: 50S ribosomal protein L29 [Thermoplasmata archaeon]|nr:50S ribosomal protein L29 [Thermoplasmata archaeon]